MTRKCEVKHAWFWEKNGVFYRATLSRGMFTVRTASKKDNDIIIRISGLTLDSQNKIIKSLHKIKLSLGCDL
jgi:hypothetical protein